MLLGGHAHDNYMYLTSPLDPLEYGIHGCLEKAGAEAFPKSNLVY